MNVPQPRTDRSRSAARDGATDPGSPPDAALDSALEALATPVALPTSSRRDETTVLDPVQLARACRRTLLLRVAFTTLALLVVGILLAWRLFEAPSTTRTERPPTRVTALTTPTPVASAARTSPAPVVSADPVPDALPVTAVPIASPTGRPAPAPVALPVRPGAVTSKPPVSSLPPSSDLPEGP